MKEGGVVAPHPSFFFAVSFFFLVRCDEDEIYWSFSVVGVVGVVGVVVVVVVVVGVAAPLRQHAPRSHDGEEEEEEKKKKKKKEKKRKKKKGKIKIKRDAARGAFRSAKSDAIDSSRSIR